MFAVSNLLRPTKSEREFVGKIHEVQYHCRGGQLTKNTSFFVPALSSNSLVSLCLKLSSQDRKSDWLTLYQMSTSDPISCSQRQDHTSKCVLNLSSFYGQGALFSKMGIMGWADTSKISAVLHTGMLRLHEKAYAGLILHCQELGSHHCSLTNCKWKAEKAEKSKTLLGSIREGRTQGKPLSPRLARQVKTGSHISPEQRLMKGNCCRSQCWGLKPEL